jgi:hypothetical protein
MNAENPGAKAPTPQSTAEADKPTRAYEWKGDVRSERLQDVAALAVKRSLEDAEVDHVGLRRFVDFVRRHSDRAD